MRITSKNSENFQIKHTPGGKFFGLIFTYVLSLYLAAFAIFDVCKAELKCDKFSRMISCELTRYTLVRQHSHEYFNNLKGVKNALHQKYPKNEVVIVYGNQEISFLNRMGGTLEEISAIDTQVKNFVEHDDNKKLATTFRGNNNYHIPAIPAILMSIWIIIFVPFSEEVNLDIKNHSGLIMITRTRFFVFKKIEIYPAQEIKEISVNSKEITTKKVSGQSSTITAYRIHLLLENGSSIPIIKDYGLGKFDAVFFSKLINYWLKNPFEESEKSEAKIREWLKSSQKD
jgi:hypothetical protein